MRKWKILLLTLCAAVLLSACLFDPKPFDDQAWLERVEKQNPALLYASHEKDGRFFNPWLPSDRGRFGEFLRWKLSTKQEYSEEAENSLPRFIPNLLTRIEALPSSVDFLVWIGHATFLLRINGSYYLTDPMLSNRALLPKRYTPPALSKEELTNLQGPLHVLLSHNHYDHLDVATLEALPDRAEIHVPLGLKHYVSEYHPGKVVEYDWWDTGELHGARLTCLPVQHWSRRIWQGVNTTLWASYMLEAGEHAIYFGGDSGYFIGYREFGRKFDNIDFALLPITAYHPRWFMHYSHVNVQEAILAYEDLGATYFVPTQWGTFRLGDNPPGLPLIELEQEMKKREVDPARYLRPQLGEIIRLEKGRASASSGQQQ